MDSCMACKEDEWPDIKKIKCIKRPVELLSFHDVLGTTLTSFAFVFFIFTAFILGTFIKYRETPIVKANNRNLSYVTLLSLMMSFLCSLFFFDVPVVHTCLLQNFTNNVLFALAISSVLAKTMTVLLAFNVTKPTTKLMHIMKFLIGPNLHWFVIVLILIGEFGICLVWFVHHPPFPERDSVSKPGILILQCNIGSSVMFYLALGYKSFLALLCFIVAFFAKKLPDRFNEAHHITFSMLICFSVWIGFIPAYISTKGKYMTAVRIFAIFASSFGILGSIFFPKCFTILFRPELNVRESLVKIH
ncbi:vomeronasal type-2 receptor 26-like [Gastrophryne carolinensis]